MVRYRDRISPPVTVSTEPPAEATAVEETPSEAVAVEEAPAETATEVIAVEPEVLAAPAPDFGSQLFVSSSEHASTQAALDRLAAARDGLPQGLGIEPGTHLGARARAGGALGRRAAVQCGSSHGEGRGVCHSISQAHC